MDSIYSYDTSFENINYSISKSTKKPVNIDSILEDKDDLSTCLSDLQSQGTFTPRQSTRPKNYFEEDSNQENYRRDL